jgi:hypothetical protein
MDITVIGGLGFEQTICNRLNGHYIRVIGSRFNIEKRSFPDFTNIGVDFIPQYLTIKNVNLIGKPRLIIEFSENLKSKFIINDRAVKNQKEAVYVLYSEGWKVFYQSAKSGCLGCFIAFHKPNPPITYPDFPKEQAINIICEFLTDNPNESIIADLENGKKDAVPAYPDCEYCKNNTGKFYYGDICDIVSLSCGENSVGITPSEDIVLNLPHYAQILSKFTDCVKETQFFLEFKVGGLECMLFRQGRFTVKPTKDEAEALFIYRNYIGS